MVGQLSLFDVPVPVKPKPAPAPLPASHRTDPPTSKEAARNFRDSGRLGLHQQIVLQAVREHPGSTHSELAEGTVLDWLQTARRLSELAKAGLVRQGEARPCRIKGSRCTTWWPVSEATT
jgi:hypothetical protein